jgi:hypothetical protein
MLLVVGNEANERNTEANLEADTSRLARALNVVYCMDSVEHAVERISGRAAAR